MHSEELDASSTPSSSSSFAVASHHEWTGWSSSSSADRNQESSVSEVLASHDPGQTATTARKEAKDRPGKTPSHSKPPPRKQEGKSTKETLSVPAATASKVPAPEHSKMLSNSSHSTPTISRRKLVAHDMEKMHSSAPCKISYQKTKVRSVNRLKELLVSYEGPKKGPTKALSPIPSLEDFASPRATPKRHVTKVYSGDSTVRKTNRSHDLVDPEEETEKHTNISHEKKTRKHRPPQPTSPNGYYSPWRAATARRMSALAESNKKLGSPPKNSPRAGTIEQSTPSTQPLTGTPHMKRTIKTNVMLSEISPPPLSAPPSPRQKPEQQQD